MNAVSSLCRLVLVVALASSCGGGRGGGSGGGGAPPIDVSGGWDGAWTSTDSGNSGPLHIVVASYHGSDLTGEIEVHGACGDNGMTMHGSISGAHVHFEGGSAVHWSIDGVVDADPSGDSISGAYIRSNAGSCGNDSGTFLLERP